MECWLISSYVYEMFWKDHEMDSQEMMLGTVGERTSKSTLHYDASSIVYDLK